MTLIEVILTAAVLLIAAGLFVGSMGGWKTAGRLDRNAEEIRALLTGLRNRAVEERKTIVFKYFSGTAQYSVSVLGEDVSESSEYVPAADDDVVEADDADVFSSHSLDAGLTFLSGSSKIDPTAQAVERSNVDEIRFNPEGRNVVHTFGVAEGGRSITLKVDGVSGTVSATKNESAIQ
jgi:Tfp pilus assembly protein FimT